MGDGAAGGGHDQTTPRIGRVGWEYNPDHDRRRASRDIRHAYDRRAQKCAGRRAESAVQSPGICGLAVQTHLTAEEMDQFEDEVRRRFRHFTVPSLAVSDGFSGERVSRTVEVQVAVESALDA
ncbi:hypothetical protein GCM10009632_13650 [Mycolicibacterium alvei]|uniref:Uncharacterized protein n=1 Tax=Mycolicibacterium alvei TaxID=67081 RepID=A0A6N4UT36_9MYCO|nr:hypothetical protein MALV_22200 [Mycolicibacterium alvei]